VRTFEAFYSSFMQQPVLLWCAAAAGLGVVGMRRSIPRSTWVFCVGFGLLPFVDAWLTADDVAGFGALRTGVAEAFGSFFAIAGDYRVFLLFDAATPSGGIAVDLRKALRAVSWSLIVPVAAFVVHSCLPDAPWRGRATFLFYEVAFLVLVTVRQTFWRPGAAWTRAVFRFVVAYYALWALADGLILVWSVDAAFLVRTVANVLYYGGLLAVTSLAAPVLSTRLVPSPRAGLGGAT
jgi:hypothetical protein